MLHEKRQGVIPCCRLMIVTQEQFRLGKRAAPQLAIPIPGVLSPSSLLTARRATPTDVMNGAMAWSSRLSSSGRPSLVRELSSASRCTGRRRRVLDLAASGRRGQPGTANLSRFETILSQPSAHRRAPKTIAPSASLRSSNATPSRVSRSRSASKASRCSLIFSFNHLVGPMAEETYSGMVRSSAFWRRRDELQY